VNTTLDTWLVSTVTTATGVPRSGQRTARLPCSVGLSNRKPTKAGFGSEVPDVTIQRP
jgi:hypothetical protein